MTLKMIILQIIAIDKQHNWRQKMENDNYDLLSDWAEQELWQDEINNYIDDEQLEVEDE